MGANGLIGMVHGRSHRAGISRGFRHGLTWVDVGRRGSMRVDVGRNGVEQVRAGSAQGPQGEGRGRTI
eukprot:882906-Prymnesium_polylepis.1